MEDNNKNIKNKNNSNSKHHKSSGSKSKNKRHKTKKVSINIIYEDDDIIVVNKPSGLLTIDNYDSSYNSLYHEVYMYVSRIDKHNRIFVVHRLDKDTSGIVIFAKNNRMKNILQKEFENHNVIRYYEGVVSPKFSEQELSELLTKNRSSFDSNFFTVTNYLFVDKFNNVFVSRNKTNMVSINSFSVESSNDSYVVSLNNSGNNNSSSSKNSKNKNGNNDVNKGVKTTETSVSLLNIKIETGKRNQIRAALSYLGHPLLGDNKYDGTKAKRLHLNFYHLEFPTLNDKLKQTKFTIKKLFKV